MIDQFKNNITYDAQLVIISGLVFLLISLTKFGLNWNSIIIFFLYMGAAYRIECMLVGSCHIYARYSALLLMVLTVGIIMRLPQKAEDFSYFNKILYAF